VLGPAVHSRVEEWHDHPGERIHTPQRRSLRDITFPACSREVPVRVVWMEGWRRRLRPRRAGNDVVHSQGPATDAAVLTPILRAALDLPPQSCAESHSSGTAATRHLTRWAARRHSAALGHKPL
jgi:hypothetical protein